MCFLSVKHALIDMCIEAEMEEVSVILIAKEKKIGEIRVSGKIVEYAGP